MAVLNGRMLSCRLIAIKSLFMTDFLRMCRTKGRYESPLNMVLITALKYLPVVKTSLEQRSVFCCCFVFNM